MLFGFQSYCKKILMFARTISVSIAYEVSSLVVNDRKKETKNDKSPPATFPCHQYALTSNMQQIWVSNCSYHPCVLFLVVLYKFKKFFFLFIYVNSLGGSHSLASPGYLSQ